MKQSLAAQTTSIAFEIKIYNRKARERARQEEVDGSSECHWAELTSRVVHARDASEARQLAQRSWPPEEGYVISSVSPVTLQ